MGRIRSDSRKYEVKRLTPLHYSILRLVARGCTNNEVAATLGVSRNTVSNVKNSAVAQPVLADMGARLEHAAIHEMAFGRAFARSYRGLMNLALGTW